MNWFLSILAALTIAALMPFDARAKNTLPESAATDSLRKVQIRQTILQSSGVINLHVTVVEGTEDARYPVGTLGAEDFRVTLSVDPEIPLKPLSLTTFTNAFPPRARAGVIVFDNSTQIPEKWRKELRSQLSQLITALNARALALWGLVGEQPSLVAEIHPTQPDNPVMVIKNLVQNETIGGPLGDYETAICTASQTITDWLDTGLKSADQITAIIITRKAAIPLELTEVAKSCVAQLSEANAHVFSIQIAIDDDRNDGLAINHENVDASFLVKKPLNLSMALANVRNLIESEYSLSVRPSKPIWSLTGLIADPTASVRVSYHGREWSSKPHSILRNTDTAVRLPSAGFLILGIIACTLIGALVWRRMFGRIICANCGLRVKRDHSNCPFRSPLYHAHLIVLNGPLQGQRFPLLEGNSTIGRSRWARIILQDRTAARVAATIRIEPQRAFLDPAIRNDGKRHILVNGWPILEGRFLSESSIIRIGSTDLLFEPRI